jgi:hypothetical protein
MLINNFDIILLSLLYIGACTGQAFYQAHLFKKDKHINHIVHGIFYAMWCILIALAYYTQFDIWIALKVGCFGIITRAAFFDPILNIIRKKPLWYNSIPLIHSGSILDWIENKFFAKGKIKWIIALKISYILLWLIYILLILK